jgi:hypothetical protein
MKKLVTTFLFSFLSATVYADGNYGCVINVSGGFHWENGSWKLTNFIKENLLISVQGNGSRLKYKSASDVDEGNFVCTTTNFGVFKFLNCHDNFGNMVVFDEVTLKGGSSSLNGSIGRNSKYKDSLSVKEFTCQKF